MLRNMGIEVTCLLIVAMQSLILCTNTTFDPVCERL